MIVGGDNTYDRDEESDVCLCQAVPYQILLPFQYLLDTVQRLEHFDNVSLVGFLGWRIR